MPGISAFSMTAPAAEQVQPSAWPIP